MNVTESWSPKGDMTAENSNVTQQAEQRLSVRLVFSREHYLHRLHLTRAISRRLMVVLCSTLGILSFAALLASHNIADWDLWAKLALGAHVWHYGFLPQHDAFAFTPVLPVYVDHEWGAGTIFFGLLKYFGPQSLMWLKMALGCGTMLAVLWTGRRAGSEWTILFLLAIPAAGCVLFGFVPVIRSHAFTFFFFAIVLLCLEHLVTAPAEQRITTVNSLKPPSVRSYWPAFVIVGVMLIWVNIHGGFVAGLGSIGIYTTVSFWEDLRRKPFGIRNQTVVLIVTTIASLAITCVNPYGLRFWSYLLPALMAKRELIGEWQPLPVFGTDLFLVFRVLFVLVLFSVLAGWKRVGKKSWGGVILLGLTALLAWRSRRHVPFFGVASLAFVGPYLAATLARLRGSVCLGPAEYNSAIQQSGTLRYGFGPGALAIAGVYVAIGLYAAKVWVPQASLQVLAPIGDDPVREADILTLAKAEGNLAVPFNWGSYAAWRLHPKIKISIDGRYEAAFPESTFQLNIDFFERRGAHWDRLLREHVVDYVILDLKQNRLRPEDLLGKGYVLIRETPGLSALMALQKHAPRLLQTAEDLPATTINPLDAGLTANWW